MEFIFVTSNEHKAKEMSHILGFNVDAKNLDLPELQSLSVEEVASYKAKVAYAKVKKPVIVEDTGIYINAFNGFPGALAKWFVKGLGHESACRSLDLSKDRGAYAETCIAFYNGKSTKTFVGRIYGSIADHPRGASGFGWDMIFIPKGYKRTFAQMTMNEKSGISMRGIAGRKLKKFLQANKRA
jgi:non-canonical purine NTP pyrophosphatase (RdgB/HAM1 family)